MHAGVSIRLKSLRASHHSLTPTVTYEANVIIIPMYRQGREASVGNTPKLEWLVGGEAGIHKAHFITRDLVLGSAFSDNLLPFQRNGLSYLRLTKSSLAFSDVEVATLLKPTYESSISLWRILF